MTSKVTVTELDPKMLVDLDSPEAHRPEEVGSKAANLARMRSSGLPVPPGIVVYPHAPATPAAQAISRYFPEQRLAVRSSSTVEDLATASYAGQYTTVLDVIGARGISDAIEEVRASATDPHQRGYDTAPTTAMPVLVMPLVDADVAGVTFTTNPVSGDQETVIEAVAGLGEGLVSGEATPQRWIVRGGEINSVETADGSALLDETDLDAIVALANRVVSVSGPDQDLEWAIADGELHLLQVRPITALPVAPDTQPPGESEIWLRADENYSGPVRPLEYAVWAPIFEETARKVFDEIGAPIETMRYRNIGGWMYIRTVPPMDRGKDDTPPPSPLILGMAMRLVPQFRRKLKRASQVWSSDLAEKAISDWESGERVQMRETTRRLRAINLELLDDAELLSHLENALTHLQAASDIHFRLPALATFLPMGHLGVLSERLLGWPPDRVATLVQGWSSVVGGKSEALADLVEAIKKDEDARQKLVENPDSLVHHRGSGGQALRGFLTEHGHEIVGMDLTHPTWHEDPRPLIALLRTHLAATSIGPDRSRLTSIDAEHEALDSLEAPDAANFKIVLEQARRGSRYGDETERDVLEAFGLIRYAALEIGRRMNDRHLLPDVDGVFYLDLDECRSGLLGENLTDTVGILRRQFAWAMAHPGPQRYGPVPPAPPSMRYVPRPARRFMESMMWVMSHIEGAQPKITEDADIGGVRGIPSSPGQVTGPARILRDPAQFERIEPGDIVVCPATTASWSVVFGVISGIVTERGGPLSHPGILAREYGIPAVLGVPDATSIISDGQTITVNGHNGTVELG